TLSLHDALPSSIVDGPSDAELWFDTSDVPFLRQDEKDAAEIEQLRAATIRQLIDGGFTPESAIRAVVTEDMSALQHTGMLSVQLRPPGTGDANEPAAEEPAATGGQ